MGKETGRHMHQPGQRTRTPCTTSLQRLLSWAILSTCSKLSPVYGMSAWRSRRQVLLDLPLFRLLWGFPVKAWLVTLLYGFLNVWPNHPHLLLRIDISIWTWSVLSLLLTSSIHCSPNIFRKHWFTKVWILFSVVLFIRHVSAQYSNTDLTLSCWTDGFSLFCRLPWTSTHFSQCGMLPLLCWFLSLRQPLSLLVWPLYYLLAEPGRSTLYLSTSVLKYNL